jgi:hypothetical protein
VLLETTHKRRMVFQQVQKHTGDNGKKGKKKSKVKTVLISTALSSKYTTYQCFGYFIVY